jgi:hypothetical protein
MALPEQGASSRADDNGPARSDVAQTPSRAAARSLL